MSHGRSWFRAGLVLELKILEIGTFWYFTFKLGTFEVGNIP